MTKKPGAKSLVAAFGAVMAVPAVFDLVDGDPNFRAFLADRRPGQPFCYWFGPINTHRRWEKGSGKALWGIEPDSLKGRLPAFLPDVPEVREDFADYLGEAQAFDAAARACGRAGHKGSAAASSPA